MFVRATYSRKLPRRRDAMYLKRFAAFACLILMIGCGPKGDAPAVTSPNRPAGGAARTKGVIGLSVLTLTNPFFKVIADSMTAEAKKNGYEVEVVSGEFDVAKQQNQVKDFIVKKVS